MADQAKKTKTKLNHPSFFRIMLERDFTNKLRVPPAFAKNINSRNFNVSLRFGGESPTWKVTVKRSKNCYYFTKGWSEIVRDLQLQKEQFLVFHLVSKDAFTVAVYGRDGCAKSFSSLLMSSDGKVKEEEEEKASFVVTLTKQNKYYCCLPKDFACKTGLCNLEFAELHDSAGRKWHIHLTSRIADYDQPYHADKPDNKRYELRGGWMNLHEQNGFREGDKLEFQHVQGRFMVVNKIESGV